METRALPDPHDVVIVRRFLTPDEHQTLIHWATRELAEGRLSPNKAGPGRFFARYHNDHPGLPDTARHVKARAIREFGISCFEEEPRYRCFLGCNTEGGFVHAHVDDQPTGKDHIRLNIMLSRPDGGGMPIVGAQQLDVQETDLWCFHPGIVRHGSTPVVGSRPRFVLSIGVLVPA